ncbi:hypothetical protein BDN72DRAFT_862914 [Pluteus cervinus]|uniref:Uncharacterized protein n=1 Tax=Pluteus cervinus TaxID=181527 RepID=A0ACD3A9P5_9AGAR|nr:hypothetical protein BDN72DRAFT_862914 [Pluteus cervinus]
MTDNNILMLAFQVTELQSHQLHQIQHNRNVWVNRFPLEILCTIFRCAHRKSALQEKALLTLRLTWVCQCWRTSAIGDTGLWSVISFPHHELILRFIDLSRESRLTIILLNIRRLDVARNALPPVMRCIARIVRLTLHWTLGEPWSPPTDQQLLQLSDFVPSDASGRLPNQSVKLITLDLRNTSLQDLFRSPKRKLHLYRCSFTVNPLLRLSSTLTDLCITDPMTSIGFLDVLTYLGRAPLLRQLDFSNALAPQPHPALSAARISLPALQTLNLSESDLAGLDVAIIFLNHLDLPCIRTVRLWTDYAPSDHISSLLLAAHHACGNFPITYTSILINAEGWSQISIADESTLQNPHITLRIDLDSSENMVLAVLDHLPMNQLEYFRIATWESGSYAKDWIPTLVGVQSRVSTIFLQDDSIEDFSGSLNLIISGSFPCLRTLGFSHTPGYHSSKIGAAKLPFDAIKTCLHHTPLSEVVFYGYRWDSSEESIQVLGEIGCKLRFEDDDSLRDEMEKLWSDVDYVRIASYVK